MTTNKDLITRKIVNLLLITLAITLYFILDPIKVNNNIWLSKSDPIEINESRHNKIFEAKTHSILTIIKLPQNLNYFSQENIDELSKIKQEISRTTGYYDIKSPLHSSIALSKDEILNIKTFKEALDDGTIIDLNDYQEKLTNSKYHQRLITQDFKYFIINSSFKINEQDQNQQKQFITRKIKKVLNNHPKYQDYKLSGKVYLDNKLNENIKFDLKLLLLCGSWLILSFLFIIYKNPYKAFINAYPAVLATICTIFIIQSNQGFFTALDLITLISIMAIAISDSTHILAKWQMISQKRLKLQKKIKKLIKISYKPCLTTSITTAIGFGSFYFSQIIPLKHFAFNAFFAILLSYLIIMIFTIILIINNREELNNKNQIEFLFIKKNISRIIKYSTQNRNSLILLTITICLYSFFLYSKNFHESNFINIFFKKNSQTYKAIEVLDQKFTGSGMINLVLSSKKPDFFKKIEIFNQTNQLTKDLAKLPQITDIRSYHDPISQIHQEIATDESTLPQSDQELEQEILFIEMSRNENTKDILAKYVDFNYQDNRIVISTKNLNSRQLESLLNEITKIVNKSAISKQTSHSFAGQNIYFYKINQYITESFKSSILLTLVAIFIIMTIIYNAKLALISTIISAIPFLTILGIISALKIPLDYATIIIGATTFAIAIDNTIHLLDNYAKTKDLKKNLQTIYHPLTLNMFLFSLTFLIFCLSSLVLLNKFGFFSFLNIVIAFITNLFLTTILLSF